MNNELQQHKTSDKIKWICTLVAFIIVGVMLIGIVCGWFEKKETPAVDEPSVSDESNVGVSGNSLIITPEDSGTRMRLAAAPLAATENSAAMQSNENSYTLTATIEPSNASNQSVDWSVAWKDSNSSWAKGKSVTNYVTITPTSDGALTATVTCLSAFGEQIIVTVVPRGNTAISATCTLDYRQTITGVVSELSHYIYNGSAADDTNRIATTSTGGAITVNLAPSTYSSNFYQRYYTLTLSSTYTLPINTVSISYKLNLTSNFRTALTSQGCNVVSTSGATFDTVSNATISSNKQVTMSFGDSGSTGKGCADYYGLLCTGLAASGSGATKFNADTYSKFITAAKNVTSGGHFTITITATGSTSVGENTTFTATTTATFSSASLAIAPTGISTNQSALVF